jgi:CHASE3 domain sensor protein
MALRFASSLGRKAVVIFALSSMVIVMAAAGLWAHQVYAAKARIEATAQKEAATLNDVMAKLNSMESEMQQQARTLNAKLERSSTKTPS